MQNNKISPERWQEIYGPVPQDFTMLVEKTLKKTREGPKMKRFTLRTALVLLICLMLLTGIALAAAGVFSTKNSLNMYTSAPADGMGVELQTNLHQTNGDFPDLTVKVRDAVFDGVTAYVTVEYKLKNPEKDMILSHWDTYGWDMPNIERWPGYSIRPLTDPQSDPRRKLVISNYGADVYGVLNHAIADYIYEKDDVLVLTWRIRVDSPQLFDFPTGNAFVQSDNIFIEASPTEQPDKADEMVTTEYYLVDSTPEPIPQENGQTSEIDSTDSATLNSDPRSFAMEFSQIVESLPEPVPLPDNVQQWIMQMASADTLKLNLQTKLGVWEGMSKDWNNESIYNTDISFTLKKTDTPLSYESASSISASNMKLTNVKVTFSKLATYMDIRTVLPVTPDISLDGSNPLTMALAYEWLDENGNVVPLLGCSSSGSEGGETSDGWGFERSLYIAFWPAVATPPQTITLRAYDERTNESITTFTVPLVPAQTLSPAPVP